MASTCTFQFDPVGKARFDSPCDKVKTFLVKQGLPYTSVAAAPGTLVEVSVGEQKITGFDEAAMRAAITDAGYPAKADPSAVNQPMVVLVMAWGIVLVTGTHSQIGDIGRKSWLFLILSGFATGFSWLFYFKALQMGDASKVVPIDKFSVVISMVLAFVVLKEAATLKTIIGGVFITIGTLVLIF